MSEGDRSIEGSGRVLVPQAPVLVAGFREVVWLSPEGEIEALSPAEAARRVQIDPPMLCHAVATARRLDAPGFAALDLLELFAFVHPARFCVPTPRGLAEALGLPPPRRPTEACVTLATAARALLETLGQEADRRNPFRRRGNGSRRMAVGSGGLGGAAAGRAARAASGGGLASVDAAFRMGRDGAAAAARQ